MENATLSSNETLAPVESTSNWMITLLITSIPLVGFIMLIVWAFGSDNNPNRSNFAKATLLWMLVLAALGVIFAAFFGAAIFSGMNS